MTKEELAAKLNGREYRSEITAEEIQQAKENGLVVVYGASDDLCELVGAINTEVGCYNGGEICLDAKGVFSKVIGCPGCSFLRNHLEQCKTINAIWGAEGYSWIYTTSIPHAIFDVLCDGEKYCRGIVFDMASLAASITNEIESLQSQLAQVTAERDAAVKMMRGDCENFMGLGDWNLCCKVKQGLCYGDTEACERFIPRKD